MPKDPNQDTDERIERLERLVGRLLEEIAARVQQAPIPGGTTIHNNAYNYNVILIANELKEITMTSGDTYKVGESSGNVGPNATGNTFNTLKTVAPPVKAEELHAAIKALYDDLVKQANPADREHIKGMGKVAEAEEEAKKGNTSKALELLKTAGGWVLDVVKTSASGLLKDLIKGQLTGGA